MIGNPASVPYLLECVLEREQHNVGRTAIEALGKIRCMKAFDALVTVYTQADDTDDRVCRYAKAALEALAVISATPFAHTQLDDAKQFRAFMLQCFSDTSGLFMSQMEQIGRNFIKNTNWKPENDLDDILAIIIQEQYERLLA